MIPEEIQNKLTDIKLLCSKHDVKSLYLFGSATKHAIKDDSDYDFLVEINVLNEGYENYANHFYELYDEFEELLDRKVDLLTVNMMQNPYFIRSVEQSKVSLYEA